MRLCTAALCSLLATSARAADLHVPGLAPDLARVNAPARIDPVAAGAPGPAVCFADLCPPRVSLPGFDPRVSTRGRRTELALAYLDRLHLEPFATAAWWLAASGLRLDYAPGRSGDAAAAGRVAGPRFEAVLRWRLDAFNRPVLPERHHAG